MNRLLQYSQERSRPIRLIYMEETGTLRQITAIVRHYDDQTVAVYVVRPPKDLTLPYGSILAADYKKGDEGME